MSKFYHYTTQEHLKEIQESGVIKTTESNVTTDGTGGPDVVWLFNEGLTKVPKMMYSPLYEEGELGPVPVGIWVPKCEIELIVDLDRSEVSRADKFMKKYNAEPRWLETLEMAGGCKFTNQYVIERDIKVEEIVATAVRADLMKPVSLDKWKNWKN